MPEFLDLLQDEEEAETDDIPSSPRSFLDGTVEGDAKYEAA